MPFFNLQPLDVARWTSFYGPALLTAHDFPTHEALQLCNDGSRVARKTVHL